MCRLIKTFGQLKKGTNEVESTLNIIVDFDPSENVVTEVLAVLVYDPEKNHYTDITGIMVEEFTNSLDKRIDETDWRELYRESIGDKKAA